MSTSRRDTSRRSAARLRVEQLDDRITPASTITIVSGPPGTGTLDTTFGLRNGSILEFDGANGGNNAETLSTGALLVNLPATSNVNITARDTIHVSNLNLNFSQATGKSLILRALTGDVIWSNPATSSLSTAGATILFQAGGVIRPGTLTSNGGTIDLKSRNMDLQQPVNAGTGQVVLAASGTVTTISLGGTDTSNGLGLTDAELDRITAGSLTVSAPGSLFLTDAVTAAGSGWADLKLVAAGAIFFNTGGSVTTTGDVTLTANTTGGTRSDPTGTDVTADALTIEAGTSGVGVVGNPLRTDVSTLTVASATHVYLAEANSAAVPTGIGAGGGTVNLAGGTFQLAPGSQVTGVTTTVGNGATLAGSGKVNGALTVAQGGKLAPGNPVGAIDVTGNVTFAAGSTLSLDLNGSDAGQSDRLSPGGAVNLGGATLSPTLGYTPAAGDAIVVMPVAGTSPAAGTFAGLAEGAPVTIGSSVFHLTYQGGDGNDVALIANRAPTADAGGPYAVAQGSDLTLGGSAIDPDGDALSYKWDLNGDGTTDVMGAAPVVSWGQLVALGVGANGDHPVHLTVSDGNGLVAEADAVLTVSNSAPTAYVSGPAVVVRGVPAEFTLGANDASSSTFTYAVNWGDGTTETVEAGISTKLAHAYAEAGNYTVTVTATDADGGTSPAAEAAVETWAAALLADPADPTVMDLVVGGTPGKDTIVVDPADASGLLRVKINGAEVGAFVPTGRVVVDGLAGNDTIQLKSRRIAGKTVKVGRPALFDGGDGNDKLNAGGGTVGAVLIGAAGNDKLTGGSGRDLLFGGLGKDTLGGGSGEDVLVGGGTLFDAARPALEALRAEWARTDADYADRLAHLQTGGGLNGTSLLAGPALPADGAADVLTGGGGLDVFFATRIGTPRDRVVDRTQAETRIDL